MEKRKFWSEKDIKYLEENYETLGKTCAVVLGRTEQSVYHKANKLGLKSKAKLRDQLKTSEEYDADIERLDLPLFRVESSAYAGNKVPILHECLEGHQWLAAPTHIISSRSGCPTCSGNKRKTTEEFAALTSFKVLGTYINKETPLLLECLEGHQWHARPGHILNSKSGCPYCATHGFDKMKPAICYYIKITKNNETYYKIGITNRTVADRFKADRDKEITILKEIPYITGQEAYDAEQLLLDLYAEFRQDIPGFLKSNGNTELFEYDILGLDK